MIIFFSMLRIQFTKPRSMKAKPRVLNTKPRRKNTRSRRIFAEPRANVVGTGAQFAMLSTLNKGLVMIVVALRSKDSMLRIYLKMIRNIAVETATIFVEFTAI